ncbi:hypothetical protein [uncultured Thioclava sp.]|uniref:hypothetical protein n=1 Tax=uncultured Thioclava sp. TaxID=473858 RepID=UPI0025CDE763|nr:hypothetical protein [uncultured Thioclava sp.]
MFGFGKSKDQKVYEGLQPVLAMQQRFGGIPPGFWQNPFVLGYFTFFSRFLMQDFFGDRLSYEEIGNISISVMQRLSNLNGVTLVEDAMRYQSTNNDEFEHGADMAAVLAFFMAGKMSMQTKPYLDRALNEVSPNGEQPDKGMMFAALYRITFREEIDRRFS